MGMFNEKTGRDSARIFNLFIFHILKPFSMIKAFNSLINIVRTKWNENTYKIYSVAREVEAIS